MLRHVWLFSTPWTIACQAPHGDSPGKNTGVSCHDFLQGIFPAQGSNPGISHCRRILYWLSHEGSPRILEWVAYPFSRGSSWPKNWTGVSCIAGGFFTSWDTRKGPDHALLIHFSSFSFFIPSFFQYASKVGKVSSGYCFPGGFPGDASGKEPTCQCRRRKSHRFDPPVRKIPLRKK